MITRIASVDNVIAGAMQFSVSHANFKFLAPNAISYPCLSNPVLSQLWDQCQSLGVALSTCRVCQSGLKFFYNFCQKYMIQPLPVPSLTLQFFCIETSSQTSYQTLSVYLVAIWLEHLEQGFSDLTSDEILHLICRGIRQLQSDGNSRSRCPIVINLLLTLKTQLSESLCIPFGLLWFCEGYWIFIFKQFLTIRSPLVWCWTAELLSSSTYLTYTMSLQKGQHIQCLSAQDMPCTAMPMLYHYLTDLAYSQWW